MSIQIRNFMRRMLAVLAVLTLTATLTGCDQINDWLFSSPSSAPVSEGSAPSETLELPPASAPEESAVPDSSSQAEGNSFSSPYLSSFVPTVCRDASLAEVLQNNPLDRTMQKTLDGGADVEQTLAGYADDWEKELGHALELALTAADAEQKALLENAQETWNLFVIDELRRQDALAGAWGGSIRARLSSQSGDNGPALHKLTLYRERTLALYEAYYVLESAQRDDEGEVRIQFLFDAD